MKIVTNVKPTVIEAPTQQALIAEIQRRFGLVYTSTGTSCGYRNVEFGRRNVADGPWYGINMEKRRTKRDANRKLVTRAKWIGWVYKIPANCGIKQLSRRFMLQTPSDTYAMHKPVFKLSQ